MQLAALTAGWGARAESFTGVVHSVFARACNLELAASGLHSLVVREVGALPRGFQLATPAGFSFLDHMHAGASVACRAGIIRIESSTLCVDVRQARPWHGVAAEFSFDLDREGAGRAWETAWALLREEAMKAGLPQGAARTIAGLSSATRALRVHEAAVLAASLIGLGEGLTPAGDDFLVGFLAALWRCMISDSARYVFLHPFGSAVAAAAVRTNAISRSFLEVAAVSGEVSEAPTILAARIIRGAVAEEVRDALRGVLAIGASSGAAGALGLLIGIRACWGKGGILSMKQYAQ